MEVPSYRDLLSSYWRKFEVLSSYSVTWPDEKSNACIVTKHGQKPVSLVYPSKTSNGSLLLLPDLNFDHPDFWEDKEGESHLTEAGKQFSLDFASEVIALDKSLKASSQRTPEPPWTEQALYATQLEVTLRSQVLEAETEIETLQRKKEEISSSLDDARVVKGLLYESGKALEASVLRALHVLGFTAEQYRDEDSEFDAVFECEEGRLLGEAEGKDNKAVNIEKLRQLSMNIHEDLEREDVNAPAKGILFGNGYRLEKPGDRKAQFTDKCISAAMSGGFGLVATDSLFEAAKHILDSGDAQYAARCREVMVSKIGVIEFPPTGSAVSHIEDGDYLVSEGEQ